MKSIKSMLSIVALDVLAACSVAPAYAQTDAELVAATGRTLHNIQVQDLAYGSITVKIAVIDQTAIVLDKSGHPEFDERVRAAVQENIKGSETDGIMFHVTFNAPYGMQYSIIPRNI